MSKKYFPVHTTLIFMGFFLSLTSYSGQIARMDLFDRAGNNLLFVKFEYDGRGKNTGRSVYTSDSTFLRRTTFVDDASGKRSKEISFDFNNDTLSYTTFSTRNNRPELSVFDQFNLDIFGAPVSFSASGENVYDIFHNGSVTYRMKYMFTTEGDLNRIEILNTENEILYYTALTSHTGIVRQPVRFRIPVPYISFHANRCRLRIALKNEAQLKVCVYNISGQLVAVPFYAKLKPGLYKESFRVVPHGKKLAANLYIIRAYVDDKASGPTRKFLFGIEGGIR